VLLILFRTRATNEIKFELISKIQNVLTIETTRSLVLLAGAEKKVRSIGRLVVGLIVLVNAMSFGLTLMVKVVAHEMGRVHCVGGSRCPHDRSAHETRVGVAGRHIDKNSKNNAAKW
jgi:hypothetical protein